MKCSNYDFVSVCVMKATGSDGLINCSTDFLWKDRETELTKRCSQPGISVHVSHVVRSGTGRTGEREHHIMNGSAYGHRQLDRYRHGHQLDMERKLTVTIITV